MVRVCPQGDEAAQTHAPPIASRTISAEEAHVRYPHSPDDHANACRREQGTPGADIRARLIATTARDPLRRLNYCGSVDAMRLTSIAANLHILSRGSGGSRRIADGRHRCDTSRVVYPAEVLETAVDHARCNREEIERSRLCACFYCLETFTPATIDSWMPEGPGTAFCPECAIDSVLGDASGLPIDNP